jgi:hypothetical protein
MLVLILQFFTRFCLLPGLETNSSRRALASALAALLITFSILADERESIQGKPASTSGNYLSANAAPLKPRRADEKAYAVGTLLLQNLGNPHP